MLLGITDGAVPIEGVGGFGADIGIGHGLGAGCEAIRLLQRLQPELPILTAHHADGVADLLRGGRIQRLLHQGVLFQIQPPAAEWLAGGLEHGAHLCAVRQHPDAARQRVDHQIHLPQLLADGVDGLLTHPGGEGIPDQIDGDAAGLLRLLAKPDVVVPAGTARPLVGGAPLERDADGVGPGSEGQGNARCQPEAGRGAQHQHPFRPVERARRPDPLDLLQHGGTAADGMTVAGDAALDLWVNDHQGVSKESIRYAK